MGEKAVPGLHDGHRERLKTRFLNSGLYHFEHHNILELLLFFVVPRVDTNVIAHNLIKEFTSLSGVLDASPEQLENVKGVTKNAATLISMLPQLMQIYCEDKNSVAIPMNTAVDVGHFFLNKYVSETIEKVYLMCLDNSNGVIRCDELSRGTVNYAQISTRRLIDIAIKCGAVSVILAHNHPGGYAVASNEDVTSTVSLAKSLRLINVRLKDHIIVGRGTYLSMCELGYIDLV